MQIALKFPYVSVKKESNRLTIQNGAPKPESLLRICNRGMLLNAQVKSTKPLCVVLSHFAIECARKRTASEVPRDFLKANCYG